MIKPEVRSPAFFALHKQQVTAWVSDHRHDLLSFSLAVTSASAAASAKRDRRIPRTRHRIALAGPALRRTPQTGGSTRRGTLRTTLLVHSGRRSPGRIRPRALTYTSDCD